jgi:glucose/arabinose dehydrogenase
MIRAGSCALLLSLACAGVIFAQQPPPQDLKPLVPLIDTPRVFDSTVRAPNGVHTPGPKFRVVPIPGLRRPYGLVFLPDGRMLVTERAGQIRIVDHDKVDPEPVSGVPAVLNVNLRGMNNIALHPKYTTNGLVYFTYYKPHPTQRDAAAAVLARGRFDSKHALTDVKEVFVADTWVTGPSSARVLFAPDGTLFLALGIPIPPRPREGIATPMDAQNPASVYGKILRLNDDGSPAKDNPFVNKTGYRPEIYAMGIRNAMGLAFHPETGELWETEDGPQGGDELNIIQAGKNYGWPVISYGRAYSGDVKGDTGPVRSPAVADGMEQPFLFWAPSPALAGFTFYTGDKFPEWKNSVFIGGLMSLDMTRIVFNLRGLPIRRDSLLRELGQRVRDVVQSPDGLLYLVLDEEEGALLRIEPVQ